MRSCQLNSIGVRRACLAHGSGHEISRPVACRRDFHAVTAQRADGGQSTTNGAPRTRRASSAEAARDIQNLPKQTEYSRYFRKDFGPATPSNTPAPTSRGAPRQVVFRGVRPAGPSSFGGPGRGGFGALGRGGALGGARGGARGGPAFGRGGRGRGGATRGGRGGNATQRRRKNAAETTGEDEDGENDEDPMDQAPEHLLEEHEAFETEPELESYVALMELVEGAESRYTEAEDLAAKGQKTNDKEASREADRIEQRVDDDIRAGLAQLEATQNMVRPRYEPQEIPISQFSNEIGLLPVGSGGMGHVVEDGLRLLAKRTGHEWENPRALAERLIAGDFVKFRNMPEKRDVLRMAGELGLEGRGGEKVLFAPLDEGARKAVVERLVRGRNGDAADSAITNDVLKNIARLTNGNPTITGDGKAALLRTVQSLLPANQAPPRRRNA